MLSFGTLVDYIYLKEIEVFTLRALDKEQGIRPYKGGDIKVGCLEPVRKYKIAVVGNTQLALGFRLSGVAEAYEAGNAAESEKRMRELMQREDIGMIITTSRVLRAYATGSLRMQYPTAYCQWS